MSLQTPFSHLDALVIDDMAAQQTTLRGQLGMLGVTHIDHAANADEALRQIRAKPYGLILCDYNLNSKTDGQQLFEYVRENKLLAPDCLYFMVTAESSYNSVAAATEYKPDAYLVKPITAGDIQDRLKALMAREEALRMVKHCVAVNDPARALQECDKIVARGDRWALQALQTKGQIALEMGQLEEAKRTYESVVRAKPDLIWAKLGLARAHKAAGEYEDAKRVANDIIQSPEGQKTLAAYDILAEALEAQREPEAALWALKDAALVVPSAKRQRVLGESAYRNGDLETAAENFAKALKSSKGSVAAQPQDVLALAQVQVDLGRPKEALATLEELNVRNQAPSPERESVNLAIRAQAHAALGDTVSAQRDAARARQTIRQPKADFATVAVAKAALMAGKESDGMALLQKAISADHGNERVRQLVVKALTDTGRGDQFDALMEVAMAGLKSRLHDAKKLFRNSQFEDALKAIEAAVSEYPENTSVLLEAAQMNCLSLRLRKEMDEAVVARVRVHFSRLDQLLPGSDRVATMRRYFRETLAGLSAAVA